MSLFIATGSNLGNKLTNLKLAKDLLSQKLIFIAESRIYKSSAVDYLEQPDFYNQVLEFEIPTSTPQEIMTMLLDLEFQLGRSRIIFQGPRTIDLDIIFWADFCISTPSLVIPHPRAFERSFVVKPLSELPGFKLLQTKFKFNFSFDNSADPIS